MRILFIIGCALLISISVKVIILFLLNYLLLLLDDLLILVIIIEIISTSTIGIFRYLTILSSLESAWLGEGRIKRLFTVVVVIVRRLLYISTSLGEAVLSLKGVITCMKVV